jgi:hypothetical protein
VSCFLHRSFGYRLSGRLQSNYALTKHVSDLVKGSGRSSSGLILGITVNRSDIVTLAYTIGASLTHQIVTLISFAKIALVGGELQLSTIVTIVMSWRSNHTLLVRILDARECFFVGSHLHRSALDSLSGGVEPIIE